MHRSDDDDDNDDDDDDDDDDDVTCACARISLNLRTILSSTADKRDNLLSSSVRPMLLLLVLTNGGRG